jgi:hypothetical protein
MLDIFLLQFHSNAEILNNYCNKCHSATLVHFTTIKNYFTDFYYVIIDGCGKPQIIKETKPEQ